MGFVPPKKISLGGPARATCDSRAVVCPPLV